MTATKWHHEHQVGPGDHADAECCICSENPCGVVTVAMAIEHGYRELERQRDSYETEIAHVLATGKRSECPF